MTDETTFMRGKWRCSACGRVNSMDADNVCPRCIDTALDADMAKIAEEYGLDPLGDFARDLASKQQPLGADFQAVLDKVPYAKD